MSEAEARPSNFIRQIIDEDLASGKHTTIHTRFPPEPNGYLHIGHAKSICLNFGIAQDYGASATCVLMIRTRSKKTSSTLNPSKMTLNG